MPIPFSNIPANWKQPLYWVEVDPSKAGRPINRLAALLVGTMSSTGTGTPDIQVPIGRQMDADALFGQGSELARAFRAFFANNFSQELWALPLAEPTGGAAASGTVTVAAAPTEAGTIHLYIAGDHVPVNVAAGMVVNDVATAIADTINDDDDLPVTAAAAAAVVTLTAKWSGLTGNDITMRHNYFGTVGGEMLPPGLDLTYTPTNGLLAGGAGTPVMDTAIANLGEQEFEYVSMPYTDSTSLLAWETEYGFSDAGRWGWMRQHFGHVFSAKRGAYGDLITFGGTRNSGVVSVMGFELDSPSPSFEWSAAYTAKAGRALANDPARPLQTLHMESIKPASSHMQFNLLELNTLAGYGIATQRTLSDHVPMISRETTTYQVNSYGQGDDAYELVTTLATLARLLRDQRQLITSTFPRHKLANDGTRFGPGAAVCTPKSIKAVLIADYRSHEFLGLVEDADAFKKNLIVERDPVDQNRVNVLYPPDLINQLRIFAVLAQFRLQYNRGVDMEIIGTV